MRTAQRNSQKIYYALYLGKTPIYDEYGNQTGEYVLSYTQPVSFRFNVSAARGTADIEQFGINENYTKAMVTHDMSCPINESTKLWIDREPSEPHNYVVVMVARSINSITYAIKEVSVT